MKRRVLLPAISLLAAFGTSAGAEEFGRVISSIPVIQQVAVPRQVCSQQPVAVQQPSSGGGALLGAIVGGVLGNQIGHGMGRAAATGLGAVAGAGLGNQIEGQGYPPQYAQQCSTQTYYENRTVGYNVVYEYAGKEHSVQMPYDPGATIRLQVSPVADNAAPSGSMPPASETPYATAPSDRAEPGTPVGVIVGSPTGQPAQTVYPAYPAAYPIGYPVQPAYYPRPYYAAPVGISLNLGFSSGHRHHHRHRH